jgi:hypothetical protein
MSLNIELGQMIQLSASDDGLLWDEKIGTGDQRRRQDGLSKPALL